MDQVEHRYRITELYVALFGRAPDAEGMSFWLERLNDGVSINDVADWMFATLPARQFYPSGSPLGEVVSSFYRNVLGREADPDGHAFWLAKMQEPGATIGAVLAQVIGAVNAFTGSNRDGTFSKVMFVNRVQASLAYATSGGSIDQAAGPVLAVTPISVHAHIMADALGMVPNAWTLSGGGGALDLHGLASGVIIGPSGLIDHLSLEGTQQGLVVALTNGHRSVPMWDRHSLSIKGPGGDESILGIVAELVWDPSTDWGVRFLDYSIEAPGFSSVVADFVLDHDSADRPGWQAHEANFVLNVPQARVLTLTGNAHGSIRAKFASELPVVVDASEMPRGVYLTVESEGQLTFISSPGHDGLETGGPAEVFLSAGRDMIDLRGGRQLPDVLRLSNLEHVRTTPDDLLEYFVELDFATTIYGFDAGLDKLDLTPLAIAPHRRDLVNLTEAYWARDGVFEHVTRAFITGGHQAALAKIVIESVWGEEGSGAVLLFDSNADGNFDVGIDGVLKILGAVDLSIDDILFG